ncbi:MAG: hypothetical protein P4L51_28370 [Puia sp.]|nr:hypothetical protein [Puia sp.]
MDRKPIIRQPEPGGGNFGDWLFKTRDNKIILCVAAIAVVVQFTVLKYFYPFASYIHGDSFDYLIAAYRNASIDTYLIGYAMFLRAFSVFSSSDAILVAFQYLLIQASSLGLLFTIRYFYRPSKTMQFILFCFSIFNPLYLYMANLVSSDLLFAALSLVWITLLLWIIHRPSPALILWHSLVIFLAFTVRYNALIYFLLSLIAFVLSQESLRWKVGGLVSAAVLMGLFVLNTGNHYKSLTGIWQYSPFAGWLWANNAMYAYRYVDSAKRKPVPEKFQALDNMIRNYYDRNRDLKKNPQETLLASTVYMWDPRMPLTKYRDLQFQHDTASTELKRWATMGPLYGQYGKYIIRQYPGFYAKYFLWPNTLKYYAPPLEFLANYNSGSDSVNESAKTWFGYRSRRVRTRMKSSAIHVLEFYPILSGVINVVMLFSLLAFTLLNGWKTDTPFRKGVFLIGAFWLLNAGFTIVASSAALRFQAFPIILTTFFSLLLVDWIWSLANSETTIPTRVPSQSTQIIPSI